MNLLPNTLHALLLLFNMLDDDEVSLEIRRRTYQASTRHPGVSPKTQPSASTPVAYIAHPPLPPDLAQAQDTAEAMTENEGGPHTRTTRDKFAATLEAPRLHLLRIVGTRTAIVLRPLKNVRLSRKIALRGLSSAW
jgi:hypothetical protein